MPRNYNCNLCFRNVSPSLKGIYMRTNNEIIEQINQTEEFINKKYLENLKEYRVEELKEYEKKYNLSDYFI